MSKPMLSERMAEVAASWAKDGAAGNPRAQEISLAEFARQAAALESALSARTADLKRCADALRTIDAWLASPHPLTKSEMQSLVAQALRGDPTLGFAAALEGK